MILMVKQFEGFLFMFRKASCRASIFLFVLAFSFFLSLDLCAQTRKQKTNVRKKSQTTHVLKRSSGVRKNTNATNRKKNNVVTRKNVGIHKSVPNKQVVQKNLQTSKTVPQEKTIVPRNAEKTNSVSNRQTMSRHEMSYNSQKTVERAFEKGKIRISAGVGYGLKTHSRSKTGSMVTQKIGVEFGVANIGAKGSFGLGFTIANAYGDGKNTKIMGEYNYEYTSVMQHYYKDSNKRWVIDTKRSTHHREGAGTAYATLKKDDVKFLLTMSYHQQFTNKVSAYIVVGGGVALMNGLLGNPRGYDGFERNSKNEKVNTAKKETQWANSYSYDDFDHIDFDRYKFTKITPAASACVGGSYRLCKEVNLFAEMGMIAAAFKKSYGNNFDLCSIGCSVNL